MKIYKEGLLKVFIIKIKVKLWASKNEDVYFSWYKCLDYIKENENNEILFFLSYFF